LVTMTLPEISLVHTRKLGEGHFASVFLTRHHGDIVASKVLEKGSKGLAAEMIIKDLHHKNIVKFVDAVEKDESVWILTEFLPVSVSEVVKFSRPSLRLAFSLTSQLADALVYLHDKGYYHGDIKLENMMLGLDNRLRLIDFGMAGKAGADNTAQMYASVPYAAPEVLAGTPHDGRAADVWAAGVCAFAMFVGQFPFERADSRCRFFRAYRHDGRLDVSDVPPPTPRRSAVALCRKALVVDPARRPSMRYLRHHLAGGMVLAALGG